MDADFILSPYLRSNNNIIYLTFFCQLDTLGPSSCKNKLGGVVQSWLLRSNPERQKRKANKSSKAKKCLKVSNWNGYVPGFGHSLASQTWVCLEPELASLIHCLESPSLFLHIQCPHFLYFLLFPTRYKHLGTTFT